MNTNIPLSALLLLSLLCGARSEAQRMQRIYHDSIKSITDTTVFLSAPTAAMNSIALEMRGSLPDAESFAPLQAFGFMWNVSKDGKSYHRATLRPCNPMPDDVFDHRYITLNISRVTEGHDSLIHEARLRNGFNPTLGENTMGFEADMKTGFTTIYGGAKEQEALFQFSIPANELSNRTAIFSEGRANMSFAVSEFIFDNREQLKTNHTIESLREAFTSERKTPCGFYRYLDRQNDQRYSRLGGNYTIAVVDSPGGGYDIIYIGGATTERQHWSTGMLKGHLSPTIFSNHYNLVWYDSSCNAIDNECSADIEQGAILTFNFPLLKTSLRFSLLKSAPSPD